MEKILLQVRFSHQVNRKHQKVLLQLTSYPSLLFFCISHNFLMTFHHSLYSINGPKHPITNQIERNPESTEFQHVPQRTESCCTFLLNLNKLNSTQYPLLMGTPTGDFVRLPLWRRPYCSWICKQIHNPFERTLTIWQSL